MTEPREPTPDERRARIEKGIRVIREGHGANCSSIGSVIDTIFASAVLGGTIFAAIVASLGQERIRVVGKPAEPDASSPPPPATPRTDEESRP
ncbi:MAG: hypothetical protein ACLQVI_01240 [Polyangiaceae bacterium]|jgi:hypothetical protein